MLLRFSGFDLDDRTGCGIGVFQIAYGLMYGEIEDHLRSELWWCLDWFGRHLEGPDRLYRPGKSRYAISWFKSTAHRPIQVARRMATAIEETGVFVRFMRTETPGYVVYEDEDQVVAVPFRVW